MVVPKYVVGHAMNRVPYTVNQIKSINSMENLKINQNPKIEQKFKSYPKEILPKIQFLRDLIIETAKENESVQEIEETLKWGEPSYLVKKGSTIRIDWKPKKPNQYAMYFKCTSKLVRTFKEVYGEKRFYMKYNFQKIILVVYQLMHLHCKGHFLMILKNMIMFLLII